VADESPLRRVGALLSLRCLDSYSFGYQGRQKATDRRVFVRYPDKRDPKKAAYYRHSAFSGRFLRIDGVWYLEITPTYRFTSDGYRTHPFAADYVKKMKEIELNDAVAGQVIMWAEVLRAPPDLMRTAYPFLSFGDLQAFDIGVGFDDSTWQPADPGARTATDAEGDGELLDLFEDVSDAG
jgi:hypothetical protein